MKPVYAAAKDGHLVSKSGMQTDIISRSKGSLHIIDAKYYPATGPNSLPGWPDIVKQLFYEKALSRVLKDEGSSASIRNHFVFPADGDADPVYDLIQMHTADGAVVEEYSPIRCHYVNTSAVMETYVSRRKNDFQILS